MTARLVVLLLALLALLLALRDASAETKGRVGFGPPGIGVDERIGARLPLDLRFRHGQQGFVPLGSLLGRGRPALLILAYNRCPMLCSLVLRRVADALRELQLKPGEDFDVVTLSIDPSETPVQAGRAQHTALARAGYEGRVDAWPFLVGSEQRIRTVADSIGFRYAWDRRTEQYAHPALVTLVSSRGEVKGYLHGLGWSTAELASALRGEARPSSLQALLRCFRPDTARSKYGAAVETGLRVGAALVLGALALVIVRARARRA